MGHTPKACELLEVSRQVLQIWPWKWGFPWCLFSLLEMDFPVVGVR